MRSVVIAIIFSAALSFFPALSLRSYASVLKVDTVWKEEVFLSEDILVPAGVTLTIAPGAFIRVARAENSRTDPEYLSPLVELTVRGTLRIEGDKQAPVVFSATGEQEASAWAGILIDGGTASLRNCRINSAEAAIHLLNGNLSIHDTTLSGNRYGLVLQRPAQSILGGGNRISENEYGLVAFDGLPPGVKGTAITGNRNRDVIAIPHRRYRPANDSDEVFERTEELPTHRYGDTVLNGETIWRGRVEIDGVVRVPEGSRLVVLPGTIVEFGTRDTNGDGIGENGLLIQGIIMAKGAPEAPIVFRSHEENGPRGSWDAINIMNSSDSWNLLEYCRIENAYRGLHFHFSRAAITHSVITKNYRGLQFQESTVLLRGNHISGNNSAVQCRDSVVTFDDNTVDGNFQGINFFRVTLKANGNRIAANDNVGVRIREGATVFDQNMVDGNRYGLLVMDAYYGSFYGNSINTNGETGFSLKNTGNLEVAGNFIAGNGLNGMNVQDSSGRISGNLISDNGERGIGIQSFAGILEKNNFSGNGLYAVDLDGATDVAAPRNWWGGKAPEEAVFDKEDDAAKGRVNWEEPAVKPFLFSWPLASVDTDITWRGEIAVSKPVTISSPATLTVAPLTRILFDDGAGLTVHGRLIAQGDAAGEILFSALRRKEPGSWGEILLEHANGSSFAHCIIEYATWGVHSHFSRLILSDTIVRRNYGGIRFRSGPLTVERSLIMQNTIGIRDYRGSAIVRDSAITGNETGVFVREKGGGLTLRGNNIFSNSRYNLRIGDFNDEDVPASENWWGEGDPFNTIFDGRQVPGIGIARIEPFLRAPLQLPIPEAVSHE